PAFADQYLENAHRLANQMNRIDSDLVRQFQSGHRAVFVSHPSLTYFARDYGISQFSVETHGKSPSAKALTETLKKAKSAQVSVIISQPQYGPSTLIPVAKQLGVPIREFDIYSSDYPDSVRRLASLILKEGK
ncbi:hypothetical protein EBR96_09745, partial [bacterium]|nr:hypothetical protein [bacterium]